jgi:GNAT superfamily N-acetyltransferase
MYPMLQADGLRVRVAGPDDAAAMATVHLETIRVAYRGIFPPSSPTPHLEDITAEWREAIADGLNIALAAEEVETVVGTVLVRPDPEMPQCGQLRRLHVVPSRWGHGIGTRLHDEALERLRATGFHAAGLWVLEDNLRARGMYEQRGWTLVPGMVKRWPTLGATEVRYTLDLD